MAKIKESDATTEAVELLESIESQARLCAKLSEKVDASKERLKDDRADLEESQQELTRLCLVRDEKHPLLDSTK